MSNFFDGAVMAYRDCSDFAKNMAEKLPFELQFLKPQFMEMANGFAEKANNVISEIAKKWNKQMTTDPKPKDLKPHQSQMKPEENKFHKGNGEDKKHYWLTPPDVYGALNERYKFDFDPCPFPKPDDFDGLTCEWGKSSYVNPPFGSIMHNGKKKGATAWARKAIEESKKGKRVVLVHPMDKWVLMMIEAGAKITNLGDVKWLATEDGSAGKGTGRHIACFVLNGEESHPAPETAMWVDEDAKAAFTDLCSIDYHPRSVDDGHYDAGYDQEQAGGFLDAHMKVIHKLLRRAATPPLPCNTLPCTVSVGVGHFHKGVKVALLQEAIDRLWDRATEKPPLPSEAEKLYEALKQYLLSGDFEEAKKALAAYEQSKKENATNG